VVPRRNHGADTIDTDGQTIRNNSLEKTLAVARVVDALEEGEFYWIGRRSCCHAAHVLDCNVAMANDVAVTIQVLGRSVVVGCGIHEKTGAEVLRLHLDVERRVRWDLDADFGIGDDGCDHVVPGGDLAHGNAVAGPGHDLHAIGDFLALAEVDEVCLVAGWRLVER